MQERALGINKLIEDATDLKERRIGGDNLHSSLARLVEEIEEVIRNIEK